MGKQIILDRLENFITKRIARQDLRRKNIYHRVEHEVYNLFNEVGTRYTKYEVRQLSDEVTDHIMEMIHYSLN